ncbi:MAG: succinate dehydrogenase iron-sulfur subunit [SAR324 cluster bacterium]|nr:succinate dehydrogenase iron-sulfur subunit [SAR324 cluster bacterium]
MAEKTITIQIKRQDSRDSSSYWQTFEIPYKPNSNVISCLMDIRRNPVTKEGKQVPPVIWECNCLEEVCGACTMVINGRVRQSCSALIDTLAQPVRLQPMSKFPVVRDLAVDRSRMFENLKKVKAWMQVDGYHDLGPGAKVPETNQGIAYKLSECMTCGCCMEACPQFSLNNNFIGAAPISQARLFNMNPVGKFIAEQRLQPLMEAGGIGDCGNAQNCVEACPKSIPLTESIAEMSKQVSVQMFKNIFQKRS